MRIRLAPALLIVMAALPLGGCSWLVGDEGYFRDRGDDYRKSRTIPPMEVPGGQKPQSIEPLYPIPVERTDALLGETFEVPRPSPLVADGEQGVVRIQKLGETQWILLDGAPGEVWPRIRAFLLSNQIGLDREDAANGLMETAWLLPKGSVERREKYRFRVDQGVQHNTTEIYVTELAYSRPEGQEGTVPEFGDTSTDVERETWMVRELAGYLADTGGEASVSLLAQGISTANKVYIVRGADGLPAIDLRLPFERAWASLGRALPRAGFTLNDLDRSAGIHYVTYDPAANKAEQQEEEGPGEGEAKPAKPTEDKKGFFSGMFDWWGDDEEENPAVGRSYRVQMKDAAEGVTIELRREDGSAFEQGELEFLLGQIRAHLS